MSQRASKPVIVITEGFSLASSLMAEVLQRELAAYELLVMSSALLGVEDLIPRINLVIATKSVLVDESRRRQLLSKVSTSDYTLPLAVFGDPPSPDVFAELKRCDLRGMFPDSTSPNIVIEGVRFILMGGEYFPRKHTDAAETPDPQPSKAARADERNGFQPALAGDELSVLSERELRVLQSLARGYSNKAIAQELLLAENTVKIHVKNILRKLHSGNRTEAVIVAQRMKLLTLQ